MVQRRTLSLTEKERETLRAYRDHDPHPQARERCAAVLKIADGQSAHDVAQHGLLKPRDPDTVYGWLNRYQTEGITGLRSCLHGGKRHSFR
jgi:transposase